MGLDAHVIAVGNDKLTHEVKYWRKFSALQGYMTRAYLDSGGFDSEFNGPHLLLTSDVLLPLQAALHSNLAEDSSGFFWGSMDSSKWAQLRVDVDHLLNLVREDKYSYYYYASY